MVLSKRERPARGEALIYPGKADQHLDTATQLQLQEDLGAYRALRLMQRLAVGSDLATMLAALAFGGGR